LLITTSVPERRTWSTDGGMPAVGLATFLVAGGEGGTCCTTGFDT